VSFKKQGTAPHLHHVLTDFQNSVTGKQVSFKLPCGYD